MPHRLQLHATKQETHDKALGYGHNRVTYRYNSLLLLRRRSIPVYTSGRICPPCFVCTSGIRRSNDCSYPYRPNRCFRCIDSPSSRTHCRVDRADRRNNRPCTLRIAILCVREGNPNTRYRPSTSPHMLHQIVPDRSRKDTDMVGNRSVIHALHRRNNLQHTVDIGCLACSPCIRSRHPYPNHTCLSDCCTRKVHNSILVLNPVARACIWMHTARKTNLSQNNRFTKQYKTIPNACTYRCDSVDKHTVPLIERTSRCLPLLQFLA